MKVDINNIIVLGIIILVVLLVCFKCIQIQNKIHESFEDGDNNEANNDLGDSIDQEVEKEVAEAEAIIEANAGIADMNNRDNSENDFSDELENMTSSERAEFDRKCNARENTNWGSVVSKYTGKTINVEKVGERDRIKLYMIKWQPLGGKPGGCITLEANGTYSTPLCNENIDKQKWIIKKITGEKILRDVIPKERRTMGRPFEETAFPFYMILSNQDPSYCLNYEGGGLSVRQTSNYDGLKWDVSERKIAQDPLPTQKNSKFTNLTPEHNLSQADTKLNSLMNGNKGMAGNGAANGSQGENGAVNFNINLDPELLAKLGLAFGSDGSLENLNKNINENTDGDMKDFFQEDTENTTGGRGNVDEMLEGGQGNPNCKDCNKIPDRFIKKDLVKATCIGCDNIDNVLT